MDSKKTPRFRFFIFLTFWPFLGRFWPFRAPKFSFWPFSRKKRKNSKIHLWEFFLIQETHLVSKFQVSISKNLGGDRFLRVLRYRRFSKKGSKFQFFRFFFKVYHLQLDFWPLMSVLTIDTYF